MRLNVLSVIALLVAGATLPALGAAPQPADDAALHSLRALAVTVEQHLEAVDHGQLPDAVEMARLQRLLEGTVARERTSSAAVLGKRQAVVALFGKLRFLVAHPDIATRDHGAARDNTPVDREVVTKTHGTSCANALGLATRLPVAVTLAPAAADGSDAWLRFEAGTDGTARIQTQSSGADPALQVFRDCAAPALVANDDTLGLDASVTVASRAHVPVFVHVTNSGGGGSVVVSVVAGSSNPTIAGVVRDAQTHAPISAANVTLFGPNGNYEGSVNTDLGGNYLLTAFNNTGSYYLMAAAADHVRTLYPTASCPPSQYSYSDDGCDFQNAQTITLNAGSALTGIDFSVSAGQRISGHVADTSAGPLSADVGVFDSAGTALLGISTGSNGDYSFGGIPAGTYKVKADSYNHVSQMFDHVVCGGALQTQCDLANATPLVVGNADAVANFDLQVLAAIKGTLQDAASNPVPYGYVYVMDSQGTVIVQVNANFDGTFNAGPLGVGSYRLYAAAGGYFSQAYGGSDCATTSCDAEIAGATPVVISQLGQQPTANFRLDPLPLVTGHVRDAHTGQPLSGVWVAASLSPPSSFNTNISTTTNQNGDYQLPNVPAGQYYLWAISGDHIDRIYPDLDCEAFNSSIFFQPRANCSVAGAVLLRIAPALVVAAHDFELDPSSRISGNVLINTGNPAARVRAPNVSVDIFDDAGTRLTSALTDGQGNYVVSDLPPGTYYAQAPGTSGGNYYQQVWANNNCGSSCVPTTGAAISLSQGAIAPGIDFTLIAINAIVGRVTDGNGAPVGGGVIDLFLAQDSSYRSSAVVDSQGFYVVADSLFQSYFVATEAGSGYVDQVYAGVECPLGAAYYGACSFANATAVTTNYGAQPHVANFMLQVRDEIFANGFQ